MMMTTMMMMIMMMITIIWRPNETVMCEDDHRLICEIHIVTC